MDRQPPLGQGCGFRDCSDQGSRQFTLPLPPSGAPSRRQGFSQRGTGVEGATSLLAGLGVGGGDKEERKGQYRGGRLLGALRAAEKCRFLAHMFCFVIH